MTGHSQRIERWALASAASARLSKRRYGTCPENVPIAAGLALVDSKRRAVAKIPRQRCAKRGDTLLTKPQHDFLYGLGSQNRYKRAQVPVESPEQS